MKPHIGISEKHLKSTSDILSHVLANEMILYVKTRKAHWNVRGESFMELHRLYEEHYKLIEESVDMVAERIGKLGHNTIGTMIEFTKLSTIKENPGKYNSSKDTLKELLKDHEALVVQLRGNVEDCIEKNKDSGTADFLTWLMEEHETMAWILRRYLD
ncbi:MAG: DNA starvation/stationary phase protection protein [Bacteroidia bacterium]|nr:DNA starvation/stationary phase protection protein [Bacteroidia bacterium]